MLIIYKIYIYFLISNIITIVILTFDSVCIVPNHKLTLPFIILTYSTFYYEFQSLNSLVIMAAAQSTEEGRIPQKLVTQLLPIQFPSNVESTTTNSHTSITTPLEKPADT